MELVLIFFIPQNNLFLTNIHSAAQKSLFKQLYGMYEKGIECLLQTLRHSFRTYITGNLRNPRLTVCSDEHNLITEAEFDVKLFHEIQRNDSLHLSGLQHCYYAVNTLEQNIKSSCYRNVRLLYFSLQLLCFRTCTVTENPTNRFIMLTEYAAAR